MLSVYYAMFEHCTSSQNLVKKRNTGLLELDSRLLIVSIDYTESALPVAGTTAGHGDHRVTMVPDRTLVSGRCGSPCPHDACADSVWKALWHLQVRNKET